MTYPRDDLRAEFETRLLAAVPSLDIEIENIKFDQPKTLWASCWVAFTDSGRASIGTTRRFDRHPGFFNIDLYAPEDTGTKTLWETAGVIEATFNATAFTLPDSGYVVCQVAKIVNGPLRDGYLTKTLMIPFYLDSCTP